ncbi:unnamed protein product [Paramecium octaurelia]|uniref:Uncharacterized protein n=1 Tax=Paramecium octaurelia TaxID=43137 RepID=A0A8S1VDB7_PAROT|nr:unnamed protein product [Paramecium octaurelia]
MSSKLQCLIIGFSFGVLSTTYYLGNQSKEKLVLKAKELKQKGIEQIHDIKSDLNEMNAKEFLIEKKEQLLEKGKDSQEFAQKKWKDIEEKAKKTKQQMGKEIEKIKEKFKQD